MRQLYCFLACAFLLVNPAKAVSFTDMNVDFPSVYLSDAAFGDYDNDGDLDMILIGFSSTQGGITKLYNNDGYFIFDEVQTSFPDAYYGTVSWGDYDNDGDLDLLMLGGGESSVRRIYTNLGDGQFSDDFIQLDGEYEGYGAWGDYDNDGDLDILELGSETRLHRNDGNGTFTLVEDGMIDMDRGSANWGDCDNDGDLDILLTGRIYSGNVASRVYRNDGDGGFTDIEAPLYNVYDGEAVWGDYDNDGDLDILLCGSDSTSVRTETRIYRNEGNNMFADIGGYIPGAGEGGSAAWADFDNDGNLDFVLGGIFSHIGTQLFKNYGDELFQQTDDFFVGHCCGSLDWGDYDNDGDLDLMVTAVGAVPARIYRNDTEAENLPPTAPDGLISEVVENRVTLSWRPAVDDHTPAPGLTYNLRIGTSSRGIDILSPMSDIETGYRLIPAMGNANHDTSWTITGLSDGIYYWSVQAVDNSYLGSEFADEQTFEIGATSIDEKLPLSSRLPTAYPNPFNATTIISFSIPAETEVDLAVYDIMGRKLAALYNGRLEAGEHKIRWNAGDRPSGVYFYRFQTGGKSATGLLTLLK